MAGPEQQWARDPEIAAGPANDTTTDNLSPIMKPQNKVADPVWGVQAPAGGVNAPLDPEIPVTKGE